MPIPSELFNVAINCTNLATLTSQEKAVLISTQNVVLFPFIFGWFLLIFAVFLFGFTSIGQSKKMLITQPNYFIVFIFILLSGGLILYLWFSGIWVLPFI